MKLLTLNIQQYAETHGPWEQRRELIEAAISASGADAVALQAVGRDAGREDGLDQAAQLAARLPAYRHVVYAFPEDERMPGQAILARIPPLQHQFFPLSLRPQSEDGQHRFVLCATFELGGRILQLFNCHFSWRPEQCADNVREALHWVEDFAGPRVMLGDMNAEPGSPAMRAIAEAGFIDAWQQLRPDDPGHTFDARRPSVRIDYAWCDPSAAATLRSAEIVGRPSEPASVFVSDHFGLLVQLDL